MINPTDLSKPGDQHVDSFWAASAGPEITHQAPLEGELETDIAIIGGGYTGLSAAYHLGREFGVKAHVLEANRVGWGCSGRNGGFVSAGIGKENHHDWIRRWGVKDARRVFDQGRAAVNLVDEILNREQIDADRTPNGGLELAHRPSRFRDFSDHGKFLRDMFGYPVDLLSAQDVRAQFLDSRECHGALYFHEGFALHALRYARGLAEAAQRAGAILHGASPVTDWAKDGAVHILRTPRGRVRARNVIVATNGYGGDRLHGHLNGRLLPVLSNIIVTRPLTEAELQACSWQTTLRIADSRRLLFYYRRLADRRVLFGARGGIEDTPSSTMHRRQWMARRLAEMFPALRGIDIEHFWHGWVCLSYDRNPHVGTVPDDPSIHYALAYIGSGVALATYCGRLLAQRVAGDSGQDAGPLLSRPLPRFPVPGLRRWMQRAAYGYYALRDEYL